ncbi:MAG TPA: ABC transporter ATP-binding protein [Thermoanaerobaculia bacterium]
MSESPPSYSFSNLRKVYRLYAAPRDRFFEALTGRPRHAEVRALDGVSGGIAKGSVLGVIGENGSGKSTLFKILAGTTAQTSGTVNLSGRVASILELGSAFHPDDTGRRNVILQAALAGLSREEVADALPEIEAFAELGDFFDRPVKTYSSGMQMRLAFSVATAVLPDVILLDEALAVGDGRFQKKCVDRIFELKASGKTIFFCSHAMYYVSTLCDRALWLNAGRVAAEGDAQSVVLEYERFLARKDAAAPHEVHAPPDSLGRITGFTLVGADGKETDGFRPNEPWAAEVSFEGDVPERLMQVHLGVGTHDNVVCFTADSNLDGAGPFGGRARHRVRITVEQLPLGKGEFVANVFLGDEKALALYDSRSRTFRVESDTWRNGLMSPPVTWKTVSAPGDSG